LILDHKTRAKLDKEFEKRKDKLYLRRRKVSDYMGEWPIVICFFWRFVFVILLPVVMFSWFTTTHTALKPHIAFLSIVQSDWKTLPLLEF
jgi:hypothetical protein